MSEVISDPLNDPLQRGRECFARSAWDDAFTWLSTADASGPLGLEDLERLVWSAGLTARDTEMLAALERLHQLQIASGDTRAAVRSAFWLGYRLSFMGETGRASAWLSRAEQLLANCAEDCAERGYLLLPEIRRQCASGDYEGAHVTSAKAAAIGIRFGESDLVALAQCQMGRIQLQTGNVESGLAVLDQVMLAATRQELSPVVSGLVYCGVIACCQRVYAFDRAREWTAVLGEFCDRQPQLVMFAGPCMIHRAEILELGGEWNRALDEAQRASDRNSRSRDPQGVIADALYQQAEIFRLRGEFERAEIAYREASQLGREPQPGLALLRLAQGSKDAAVKALCRVVESTRDTYQRVRFLPAYIEALLAIGECERAGEVCEELECSAAQANTAVLKAMAKHARGMVLLARQDPATALVHLRDAFATWHSISAPYIAAKVRLLIGCACRSLGDEEGAKLEIDAAREIFARLGAAPDRAMAEKLARGTEACPQHGLTARELEVLRLVAAGKTNKSIAAELHLSERTVDRHVNNLFAKIDVSSRAAATAFAYEHELV